MTMTGFLGSDSARQAVADAVRRDNPLSWARVNANSEPLKNLATNLNTAWEAAQCMPESEAKNILVTNLTQARENLAKLTY